MAMTFPPPKPTKLTKTETIASFEAWKHNQKYNLQQDPTFRAFNIKIKSSSDPYRGLVDDGADVTVDKKNKAEKLEILELKDLLLGSCVLRSTSTYCSAHD